MATFARHATDGAWWVVAIALLGVYCGLQSYGERERRAAIALLFEPRPVAADITVVLPTDRPPEALTRP